MNASSIATVLIAIGALITAAVSARKAPTDKRVAEIQAEDIKVKTQDSRVQSLMDYIKFADDRNSERDREVNACHDEIRNLRHELGEKEDALMTQGRIINEQHETIAELRRELEHAKSHIAQLERRRDWGPPVDPPVD